MIRDEFNAQISRLVATFNKSAFTDERITLIYKSVSGLKANEFGRIVDQFIANFRQAPLPKDFQEAANKERNARFKDYSHSSATIADLQKRMPHEQRERLSLILAKEFSGSTTPLEALDVARMRIREQKEKEARERANKGPEDAA